VAQHGVVKWFAERPLLGSAANPRGELSIDHAANAELFAKQRPSDCSSIGSTISLPARSRAMALHEKRK
jgi:hypothetical protein